jgi:hypothetical protein
LVSFFAYDPAFRGGVSVASTGYRGIYTVPGRGVLEIPDGIVTVPGAGGGPHVKVFDGASGAETDSFFVGDPADRAGLTLTGERRYPSDPGVVVAFAAPAGPSLASVRLDTGEVFWVRPPGAVRTIRPIASVDLPGRVVNFVGGGSMAVRPDTVLRIDNRTVTLDAFEPGIGVIALVGPAGELLGLDGRSPTIVPPPPPVPFG